MLPGIHEPCGGAGEGGAPGEKEIRDVTDCGVTAAQDGESTKRIDHFEITKHRRVAGLLVESLEYSMGERLRGRRTEPGRGR